MLYGQVTGPNGRGKPRTVWNDVVLSGVQKLKLNRHSCDAQNKPVWRELLVSHVPEPDLMAKHTSKFIMIISLALPKGL